MHFDRPTQVNIGPVLAKVKIKEIIMTPWLRQLMWAYAFYCYFVVLCSFTVAIQSAVQKGIKITTK